jgi:hypothetical protein
MMKKIFKLALIVAVALPAVTFVGCKKGENDPAISLRSRKGRVAGEWKVAGYEMTQTWTSGSTTSTDTYSNDGTTTTWTSSTGSTSTNGTYSESGTFTFEKDGTYSMTNTVSATDYSQTTTEEGNWNFTGGVGEMKNKSQIVIMPMKRTTTTAFGSTSDTETQSWTGTTTPSSIMDIDQLKNKEMIFKEKSEYVDDDGDKSTSEGTWTLTQE